jgi:ADP-ribose pyrophosphatase YjhB (NUDIX family)
VHVTPAVLDSLSDRYGAPSGLRWEGEVSRQEFALAGSSPGRRHDVTLFVFDPDRRLALIQKPSYPPEVWRPPGGGVREDEVFEDGARREAMEELGVAIALDRFLVSSEAVFRSEGETIEWRTLVFAATTEADELDPVDTREIAAARWGSTDELAGPLRAAMLRTGRALWRYRVALHDTTLAALARAGV